MGRWGGIVACRSLSFMLYVGSICALDFPRIICACVVGVVGLNSIQIGSSGAVFFGQFLFVLL